ncbi:type I glyceraldehyde-3-phosphate dehydrogenase, partial [Candidatus Pacearchaeota archaeon]|nr:type I glyceraldehyde-3-phosphate dehydrogenase [Candidatus Pacearchaeota archaeon]
MNIAINGFGRIGKQFFLACMEQKVSWNFVINDIASLDYIVYSLKYDTVHPSPKENVVVDCTGMFTEREGAMKHIKAGAKRVLISAPAKDHDCTIVCGVNDKALKDKDIIISAGSCTTNSVSPLVRILHDAFTIINASFITTHAYTASQKLVDSADKKDMRRGRAAAESIVPSTSGASISVVESIPEIKGKLEGYALRVPVADGSLSSVFAHVKKNTTVQEINAIFKKQSEKMPGILSYNEDEIVSSDIIHDSHSCIFDSTLTKVSGNLVSVAGWYDNEWGYSNRLV